MNPAPPVTRMRIILALLEGERTMSQMAHGSPREAASVPTLGLPGSVVMWVLPAGLEGSAVAPGARLLAQGAAEAPQCGQFSTVWGPPLWAGQGRQRQRQELLFGDQKRTR